MNVIDIKTLDKRIVDPVVPIEEMKNPSEVIIQVRSPFPAGRNTSRIIVLTLDEDEGIHEHGVTFQDGPDAKFSETITWGNIEHMAARHLKDA